MVDYLETEKSYMLYGDCLIWLKRIKSNSIPCIITDPPYGISMMNKKWDVDVPSVEIFKECFRVLKNGAFGFFMSSTKGNVLAEMIMRLKVAGFETHYQTMEWVYLNGLQKAHNLSKEADKKLGVERKVKGLYEHPKRKNRSYTTTLNIFSNDRVNDISTNQLVVTEPTSDLAKSVNGLYGGCSPKPAREMIIVVRKPRSNGNTNLEQFQENGMGGTNLDRTKIPDIDLLNAVESGDAFKINAIKKKHIGGREAHTYTYGDEETGFTRRDSKDVTEVNIDGWCTPDLLVSDNALGTHISEKYSLDNWWWVKTKHLSPDLLNTFPYIYTPKPVKKEKDKGLNAVEGVKVNDGRPSKIDNPFQRGESIRKNSHISVKPVKLGCYLIALSPTNPGDVILDPFAGTGWMGICSRMSNRKYIVMEKKKTYFSILKRRIKAVSKQVKVKI